MSHRFSRARPILVSLVALVALVALVLIAAAGPVEAGGLLDAAARLDASSPYPGYFLAESVRIVHDDRCIPVTYTVDGSLDPLPNPVGTPIVTLAEARTVVERAVASWNDIPTSYIELRLDGEQTGNAGFFQTFDTVNEIHFRAPTFLFSTIAASPSITLLEDSVLTAGTDLDGDGDPDVAAGIATCADVDGDGDREWPEGAYVAGTILDNDLYFNTNGIRFTVDPADVDNLTFSVDLEGIALHELGHSIGLAHSAINQVSDTDGTPVTMYPFADLGDPTNELAMATLEADDRAFASLAYPEGTSSSGPAALGPGDQAFDAVYGVLRGEVEHGVLGQPVAGASVQAVDRHTGEVVASAVSASKVIFYNNPVTFDIIPLPDFDSVPDGRYELPVPQGLYDLRIEPLDDRPVAGVLVTYPAWMGQILGLTDFHEEGWNGYHEDAVEVRPGRTLPVPVLAGRDVDGVDFVTNRETAIEPFNSWDWVLYSNAAPGTWYAVRIPGQSVLDAAGGERFAIASVEYDTFVLDNSALPLFEEALLTTGRVLPDGTAEIELAHPLVRKRPFLAQEFDFSPLYPPYPIGLGVFVELALEHGWIDDLFLVLRVPTATPFPGFNGFPPVISIDGPFFGGNDGPVFGQSYLSTNGVTFVQDEWNYRFRLNLTPLL